MTASDLAAWLRDEITADRDYAKACAARPMFGTDFEAIAERVARCEAELAILDLHSYVKIGGRVAKAWLECQECGPNSDASDVYAVPGQGESFWPCPTVRLLGSGYRHREGYLEEWAPSPGTASAGA